jgi:ABC-type multidrug transport system fused ATPase/permease subunit
VADNDLPVAQPGEVRQQVRILAVAHWRGLGLGLVVYTCAVLAALVPPWALGQIVQQVSEGKHHLLMIVCMIAGGLVAQAGLSMIATGMIGRLAEQVAAGIREDFIGRILALPLARAETLASGDLVARATRDVDAIVSAVRYALPSLLLAALTVLLAIVMMALLGWYFCVPLLAVLPIVVPVSRWFLARSPRAYLKVQEGHARVTQELVESLDGASTVREYKLQGWRELRLQKAISFAWQAEQEALGLRKVFLPITDSAMLLPAVGVLVVGSVGLARGLTTIAAITTSVLLAQQIAAKADVALFQIDKMQIGGAALARLVGVRRMAESTAAVRAHRPPRPHDIGLHDVWFAYTPNTLALRGISLDIPNGQRLAIVGRSGAGKTTLASLVAGINTPDSGRVELNGIDMTLIPRDYLRQQLMMVTQSPFVFAGTLRDNLGIAGPGVDERDMIQALTLVGAERLVNRVGIDRELVRQSLSPLERQQISLARILLADPSVLVLDEATSQFSAQGARALERGLGALLKGRTVISIVHRLDCAADADQIAVVDRGAIVETGDHQELMAARGLYAHLWRSWHPGSRQV